MRATDARAAALATWAVVFALLAWRGDAIAWGARALALYVAGDFPRSEEARIAEEASATYRTTRDAARLRSELEGSLAIDPYLARFAYAEALRLEGREADAIVEYGRVLEADSLHVAARFRLIEVLRAAGREGDRARVAANGVEALRAAVRERAPVHDDAASAEENRKAFLVHENFREALAKLERLR